MLFAISFTLTFVSVTSIAMAFAIHDMKKRRCPDPWKFDMI